MTQLDVFWLLSQLTQAVHGLQEDAKVERKELERRLEDAAKGEERYRIENIDLRNMLTQAENQVQEVKDRNYDLSYELGRSRQEKELATDKMEEAVEQRDKALVEAKVQRERAHRLEDEVEEMREALHRARLSSPWLVIALEPDGRFTLYHGFKDQRQAREWAENELAFSTWWVMQPRMGGGDGAERGTGGEADRGGC